MEEAYPVADLVDGCDAKIVWRKSAAWDCAGVYD